MSEAKASHDHYDGLVDLSSSGLRGVRAYALAKFTFSCGPGQLRIAEPEPLFHDIRDESLEPRVAPGTDYWPFRPQTDFVVQGSAYAAGGSPTTRRTVAVQLADRQKRAEVFGRREIRWRGTGVVDIGEPEPFEEMPLTWETAYGGLDWRVPVENADDVEVLADLEVDHPGMYPRNPWGKGYLVEPGEVPEMEMPNVEDPADLLTADRLIVGDPKRWWSQPRPCSFDWVNIAVFPRHVWIGMGADAWFPGPEDASMPEVRDGDLPLNYRSQHQSRQPQEGPHPRFYQGASSGLLLDRPPLGAPVTLFGMHPENDAFAFRLPELTPRFDFEIEGEWTAAQPRLHSVVCRPEEGRVHLLWAADVPLKRPFVPSVHKYIPVAVRIDGGDPIRYEAPPTVKEEIERARAKEESAS